MSRDAVGQARADKNGAPRTTDCTVTPDQSWAATEVGSTDLTCRKHLTANIVSWICA